MGGSAFSTRPGLVPLRLSSAEHSALSSLLLPRLLRLYSRAEVPPPAPEKDSHGDLDFFVLAEAATVKVTEVAKALEAVDCIPATPTSNFAVPSSLLSQPSTETPSSTDGDGKLSIYQVDVHVCCSQEEWAVGMLLHSFGDCGMILAKIAKGVHPDVVLSPYGLRTRTHFSDKPFLVLSQDPVAILSFLKLDPTVHAQGFNSLATMFNWLSSSPYLSTSSVKGKDGGDAGPNTKERRRMDKRQVYGAWLEYLGTLPSREASSLSQEELLAHFDKAEEYATLLEAEWRRKALKDLIRPALFEGSISAKDPTAKGILLGKAMQHLRELVDAQYHATVPTVAEVESLARSVDVG